MRDHEKVSVRRQCELFGLARSTAYYRPQETSAEDLRIIRLVDEEYLRNPWKGSRKMREWLLDQGLDVNRKRVQRLMRLLGICGLNPRRSTSTHLIHGYAWT
jgi:putative transposase